MSTDTCREEELRWPGVITTFDGKCASSGLLQVITVEKKTRETVLTAQSAADRRRIEFAEMEIFQQLAHANCVKLLQGALRYGKRRGACKQHSHSDRLTDCGTEFVWMRFDFWSPKSVRPLLCIKLRTELSGRDEEGLRSRPFSIAYRTPLSTLASASGWQNVAFPRHVLNLSPVLTSTPSVCDTF
ncbi:hypothetical protein MPTK1_5g22970 [Marchantia polymorpha subsp. ruderalis]|uniref:Uncharacterized protein n=2 Tax=Marchantia polymorpha TaxID=3197 RepID=A0AAF6BLB1_MARPO|nr:hypothetical protein MARPO_0010s0159 [Marchantia polymorpha]BBN12795.1 hypothetical protein Mp_5g22970 [Marchantia polymorpha subsp. ruderalis]|eukprot:PTQ46783.1 hypothetical protein MARPO_0010s0159 [Marchantia polymorpha]